MTITKPLVTIKGTKDGLVFHMDDSCSYQDLIAELIVRLEEKKQYTSADKKMNVKLYLGYRYIDPKAETELKDMIFNKANLIVDDILTELVTKDQMEQVRKESNITIIPKTVRSGQVVQAEGDLLVVGDINQGAVIQATGSIYVVGALRGEAMAGIRGNTQAIIAASIMQPTTLRIAHLMVNALEQWDEAEGKMEFAFIRDQEMEIEKLHKLAITRPELYNLF